MLFLEAAINSQTGKALHLLLCSACQRINYVNDRAIFWGKANVCKEGNQYCHNLGQCNSTIEWYYLSSSTGTNKTKITGLQQISRQVWNTALRTAYPGRLRKGWPYGDVRNLCLTQKLNGTSLLCGKWEVSCPESEITGRGVDLSQRPWIELDKLGCGKMCNLIIIDACNYLQSRITTIVLFSLNFPFSICTTNMHQFYEYVVSSDQAKQAKHCIFKSYSIQAFKWKIFCLSFSSLPVLQQGRKTNHLQIYQQLGGPIWHFPVI